MVQYSCKRPKRPLGLRARPESTTADTNEAREVPAQHGSQLLSLPYEIRARIWQLVLPSDCPSWSPNRHYENDQEHLTNYRRDCPKHHRHQETFLGCTSLLLVCSQIYHEAIERLHQEEKVIELLFGHYRKVLRDPLEFGKPGYFKAYKFTTKCYIPKEYDALQVMRFRRLAFVVDFPDTYNRIGWGRGSTNIEYNRILRRIADNIAEVARPLARSKDLEVVRIVLYRIVDKDEYTRDADDKGNLPPKRLHAPMLKRLLPLVNAARQSGCKLIIQAQEISAGASSSDEPLAEALVRQAKEAGVDVHLELTPLPVEPSSAGRSGSGSSGWGSNAWASDSSAFSDTADNDDNNFYDSWGSRSTPFEQQEAPEFTRSPKRLYELVPECRTCYHLFGSWLELDKHLTKTPRHRRPFTPKTFNEVSKHAFHGTGERKCYTCARNFFSLKAFEDHAKNWRHGRKGIVPKYREHNGWWDRKWKRHEKLFGWF